MPLIRIDVPEGTETEKKQIIHKRVREVVLRTLAPKQVKYDYVSIREAYGIIGDGLPVIDVDLRPGREPERKKGLVDGIAEVLNETMGIKINSENLLPKWLNFSFIIIPLFILIGLISSSNTQDCGERGMLNVDRKSQEAVNCDGSPYEGRGVAATNTVNYIALGQEVYAGAAACAGCHGGGGGGGVGPAFTGGALYTTFPSCADHTKWIQLGSAGWQAEVGPTYGAEDTVSIGGMPGFQGKLTEDELYAVVVFERVVFGGGNTEEVLSDCGLLETEEEEVTTEAVSSNP